MQATNAERVKAGYSHWQATYTPAVPAPDDSSTAYAEGWKYGDWWISQGRSKADTHEAPGNWSEARTNGFWDRLAHTA